MRFFAGVMIWTAVVSAQTGDALRVYSLAPSAVNPDVSTSATSLPTWIGSSGGANYKMVGSNPTVAAGNQTTTVNATVIPLIVTFSDGTVEDATAPDPGCNLTDSPANLTLASPLFNNYNFAPGGLEVGNTQYLDFFQRANFWQYTKPGGVTPDYHVLLNGSVGDPIAISVPADQGSTVKTTCGKSGRISLAWFEKYLSTTVFPALSSQVSNPGALPIFLIYQTFLYQGDLSDCCVGGYHTAFSNPVFGNATETYIFAGFSASSDVAPLSHEIGEWMDDPLGNNPTPKWGHTGQVSACQSNLEVGDPLSGINITATMPNGFTYHVQELAFASWFFDQVPSTGIFGWYSSNGTFKTGAATCVDQPAVQLSPGSLSFAAQNVGTVSAPTTFSIINSGSAPLTGIAISVTGTNAADFAQTNNCPASLNPGALCKVSVTYAPTSAGIRFAEITIADNAPNSPQSVSLTGGDSSGLNLAVPRVTTTAPGSTCVTPAALTSFTPADHIVYIYFDATVVKADTISTDWMAPDGAVITGKTYSGNAGSFCFTNTSLDISDLPASRFGAWSARISHNGAAIVSIPFTVTGSPLPVFNDRYILSQVADGGGWRTTFNLINPSSAPVTYQLNVVDDSGRALTIDTGSGPGSVFNGTVAPGASVTYISSGTLGSHDGSAVASSTGPLVASGVFSYSAPASPVFEAAVPAFSASAQTLLLPFDNTKGKATGLALSNNGAAGVNVAFVFRSEAGTLTSLPSLFIAGASKAAFVLTDNFPQLANVRGTLTMDGGSAVLTALGIRGLPTGAFTSLPVYAVAASNPVVPRQILSHVIDGGIWQSTITLINTDSQAASYQMRILDSMGNLTQTKLNGIAGSLFIGTIAPLASVTLVTEGVSAPTQLDGWADITSSQRIQAQLVFDQNTPGQPVFEAAVPAIAAGQSSVAMPYDNSNGLVTGIAVTNIGAAASVQVAVRDEAGNVTDNKTVTMGAGAKTTFVLPDFAPGSAGKRGLMQVTAPGGSLAALALRFDGLEFTTLPVSAADPAAAPALP